jgi:2,3-bisphosphoglycerate-independent phosphoglycerate mutase
LTHSTVSKRLPNIGPRKKKAARVLLVILDGFGEGTDNRGNAITRADMRYLKELKKKYPWTLLKASGNAVGLPKGYQGNSEVGHFTIGSGRITFQSFEAINQAIRDGSFFKKKCLVEACKRVRAANAKGEKKGLHLLGMVSDEGVHSHIDHLFALLKLAKQQKAFPIFIHAILDGRDVPERSAAIYLKKIQNKIKELGLDTPSNAPGKPLKAQIVSLVGRFYAMDRDSNWDRTQKAYDLFVRGIGEKEKDPLKALKTAYSEGAETDYYVPPILLNEHGTIRSGDSVLFFNYRTDRSRQITGAFMNKKFDHFKVTHGKIHFVAMGPYTDLAPVAFPTAIIKDNLGQILAQKKIRQLRIAETEKYAHVTYFLNSQVETPQIGEDRQLIDSPKCPSYAEKPKMSAPQLTNALIQALEKKKYGFIAVNYANADLVGHSGNLKATVQCCKVLDECLSKVIPAAFNAGYDIFLTGDHGNAEQMFYKDGTPCPAHTTNPVIGLWISENSKEHRLRKERGLQDVAPTILKLLGVQKPRLMTGKSLIDKV